MARPHRGFRGGLGRPGLELVLGFVEWGMARGVEAMVVELEPANTLKFVQCHFLAAPLGLCHRINGEDVMAVLAKFDQRTRKRLVELRAMQDLAESREAAHA